MATSFKVSEIKCTDLLNLEWRGVIDPYVIIEYLGKSVYFAFVLESVNRTFLIIFTFGIIEVGTRKQVAS